MLPYAVEGTPDDSGQELKTFSKHLRGLDFYLDPSALDPDNAAYVRDLLRQAMASLEERAASCT